MSIGTGDRTKYQTQSEAHLARVKEAPEWMDLANEALKPWGTAEMTLQHAISVALQAAYEAGTRGDYPERIERETERPARLMRSRPGPPPTVTRITRGRISRTKT